MLSFSIVVQFASFFPGRTDVCGAIQGRAKKEKVTLAHYRRHVEGVMGHPRANRRTLQGD